MSDQNILDEAVDKTEEFVIDALDGVLEEGLDDLTDDMIRVVDENFDHLTGNERADLVASAAATWLTTQGVAWVDEHEEQAKAWILSRVSMRFDQLREKIDEWREGRPERVASRRKKRAERKAKRRSR